MIMRWMKMLLVGVAVGFPLFACADLAQVSSDAVKPVKLFHDIEKRSGSAVYEISSSLFGDCASMGGWSNERATLTVNWENGAYTTYTLSEVKHGWGIDQEALLAKGEALGISVDLLRVFITHYEQKQMEDFKNTSLLDFFVFTDALVEGDHKAAFDAQKKEHINRMKAAAMAAGVQALQAAMVKKYKRPVSLRKIRETDANLEKKICDTEEALASATGKHYDKLRKTLRITVDKLRKHRQKYPQKELALVEMLNADEDAAFVSTLLDCFYGDAVVAQTGMRYKDAYYAYVDAAGSDIKKGVLEGWLKEQEGVFQSHFQQVVAAIIQDVEVRAKDCDTGLKPPSQSSLDFMHEAICQKITYNEDFTSGTIVYLTRSYMYTSYAGYVEAPAKITFNWVSWEGGFKIISYGVKAFPKTTINVSKENDLLGYELTKAHEEQHVNDHNTYGTLSFIDIPNMPDEDMTQRNKDISVRMEARAINAEIRKLTELCKEYKKTALEQDMKLMVALVNARLLSIENGEYKGVTAEAIKAYVLMRHGDATIGDSGMKYTEAYKTYIEDPWFNKMNHEDDFKAFIKTQESIFMNYLVKVYSRRIELEKKLGKRCDTIDVPTEKLSDKERKTPIPQYCSMACRLGDTLGGKCTIPWCANAESSNTLKTNKK